MIVIDLKLNAHGTLVDRLYYNLFFIKRVQYSIVEYYTYDAPFYLD